MIPRSERSRVGRDGSRTLSRTTGGATPLRIVPSPAHSAACQDETVAGWTIGQQRDAVLQWVASDAARLAAGRALRTRGLGTDQAPDIVNDCWLAVRRTFDRRVEPFEGLHDDAAAERYARRAIANRVIDIVRSASTRRETSLAVLENLDQAAARYSAQPTIEVDGSRQEMERLHVAVADRAEHGYDTCRGCPPSLVVAVALFVCNTLLVRSVEAPADLSSVIHDGLRRHDPSYFDVADVSLDERRRRRRSRCTQCVTSMLRSCASAIGLGDLQ